MKTKDKKIIEDAERENIPIFVFTAKDILSCRTLKYYALECLENWSIKHTISVLERYQEFMDWQIKNSKQIKYPD